METLLIPLGAAVTFVVAMRGFHLVRTTGLEEVSDFQQPASGKSQIGFGALLDGLGRRLLGTTMRIYGPVRLRQLEERIRRSGRPQGLTLTIYLQRQGGSFAIGLILLVLFVMTGGTLGLVLGLFILVALTASMPLWLYTETGRRVTKIESDLPDFLDVLGVTVQAGLGFRQAVERVCEVSEGPLAEEMTNALREMALGASRRKAFTGLRDRTKSATVAAFVAALLQAEELGVPLADALEDIARDARRSHAEKIRQKMAKVGSKASMVITMTIVPGAIILIASSFLIGNEVFSELF
ncbi:MAG: type II secretion system F family protein [Micrococcales bacterium]|nr:type II secretion system F family protein [Micrococcales bacterium]